MDSDGAAVACPECGESLPAAARFCPHCRTGISEDGESVDLTALGGIADPEEGRLVETDSTGRARAERPVRVVAGFAASVPLAPLWLFLVASVVDLTPVTGAAVFLAGWAAPGALLSRARVPAVAFGHGLYLVSLGTVAIPVAVAVGGTIDGVAVGIGTVTAASLVVAGLAAALGTLVLRRANDRTLPTERDDLPERTP